MGFVERTDCYGCAECIGCGRDRVKYMAVECDKCYRDIEDDKWSMIDGKIYCKNCAKKIRSKKNV